MKVILASVFLLGFLAACEEVIPMEPGMMGDEVMMDDSMGAAMDDSMGSMSDS